jgi:hypothetical protein
VLWVHDEIVVCCRPEIAEQVGEILVRNAKEPGSFYGFKVPLDAEFKVGRSWAGDSDASPPSPDIEAVVVRKHDVAPRNCPMISTPAPAIIPEPVATKSHIPLPDLISEALVDGKVSCPFHDDRTPSCHIYDDHFFCFGCNARGDAVDWLMMVEGLDRHSALQVLEGDTELRPRAVTNPDNTDLNRRRALRYWKHAVPIAGTLAERYLVERRRIDLIALPDYGASCLRFHAQCPFGLGTTHPCLLVLRRDIASDEPTGVHRIALTPDGEKLERRLLGTGGIVKLWPLGPRLVVGEGVETTLAAATRITHRGAPLRPAWAAVSTSTLGALPIIPGVEELIILVDHDINGAGQAAAFRCSERWSRGGRRVVRLTPKRPDSDFNDLVMEAAS